MLQLLRRRMAVRTPRAARYRAAPHVVAVRQDERTILLDPRRGRYFGLDGVGAEIWQVLTAAPAPGRPVGATEADLVERLESRYTAPREQLERDAGAFVERLRSSGLVVSA